MTINLRHALLASLMLPLTAWAQQVDRTKYPDYSTATNPDPSLMRPRKLKGLAAETRPDHVNNAETKFFPPVFNQDGGSCGSASRICYMFTHELNSFRNLNGKDAHNYYPSHFVWLLTNGNSGKDNFVQFVGVPSAATYGGQTYSKYFGSQQETQNDFGWMTGYEKWHEAMFNRMLKPTHFAESVGTEAGREALKNWLWNHNGDTDFHSGGIVGIGVASGGTWKSIDATPTNNEIGVTGKSYVAKWGTMVDHALTIVGYDDRIEFDLNGNGVYGEKSADERGAWIIVNSWGDTWQNDGFIYCPYAYAGATFNANGTFTGNWWTPEVYNVRKNYVPQRTIKINMDYSRRSELYLMAGVSNDLNATEPAATQAFDHFKYAGDGNNGSTVPAPEVPMLGRWVDGKLHDEPMEFGYDLTDLTDKLDPNDDMKYFFIVDTKSTAVGEGHIYNASIIDYTTDEEGVEIPFTIDSKGVTVKNAGNRTIISVVVPGRGVKAAQNVCINNKVLQWTAPARSTQTLAGYKVYQGNKLLATLDASATSYELPAASGTFGVSAVYTNGKESKTVSASYQNVNYSGNFAIVCNHTGFTLPDVFTTKYDEATIEYWIKPTSLVDWNQSAGPGWGTFMIHANADGTLTAGWDTSNRLNASGALHTGTWTHVSLVVNKNVMTAYINGEQKATITSQTYSGIGGFGDLVFNGGNSKSDQYAQYDEIRIWKKARTAADIKADYKKLFAQAILPEGLVAYYPGTSILVDGVKHLRDFGEGQHHGAFTNSNYSVQIASISGLGYDAATKVSIVQPTEQVVAGQPVTLQATGSYNIKQLTWTATDAGVEALSINRPTLVFTHAGAQTVKVVATNVNGNTTEATATINVAAAVPANAAFTTSSSTVATGDRVTLMPSQHISGYTYAWSMPGANITASNNPYVTISYAKSGTYKVMLTVTDTEGRTNTKTQTITVNMIPPKVAFDVEPAVVHKGEPVLLSDNSTYDPEKWTWLLRSNQNALYAEGNLVYFKPQTAGIFDVTLTASNATGKTSSTRSSALVVCNADSKTGLAFMPSATATVTAKKVPFNTGQTQMTIEFWMRANTMEANCNGIGENAGTVQLSTTSTGKMRLGVSGKYAQSTDNFVIANEWHHYAVTFYTGMVLFYRDGEQISISSVNSTTLPAVSEFKLGGTLPMNGTIDEFRVWNRDLSRTELHKYITEPISQENMADAEASGLVLYYKFDQNSGDVQDATSNNNVGIRSGFGPDGDAWSNSEGVFALNFGSLSSEDVTSQYLTNYKAPFNNTGMVFNSAVQNRFYELSDWKQENIDRSKYATGAHVDLMKNNCFTITSGWDGFAQSLTDNKTFQTLSLPTGAYVFQANYGSYEAQTSGCYLVAAEGNSLPNTVNLDKEALAYSAMQSKDTGATGSSLFFLVTEPSTVSVGVLANMSGQQCLSISSFSLSKYEIMPIEKLDIPSSINELPAVTPAALNSEPHIYDLSGRRVTVPGKGVFIIGGKKVVK